MDKPVPRLWLWRPLHVQCLRSVSPSRRAAVSGALEPQGTLFGGSDTALDSKEIKDVYKDDLNTAYEEMAQPSCT